MTRTTSCLLIVLCFTAHSFACADDGIEFFEKKIRPVLVKHCYECHSAASDEAKGELVLDYRDGLRGGGESGAAIVPGKPQESLLLEALRHESFEMPPKKKLPAAVIADFEQWIRLGAVDPRDKTPSRTDVAASRWKAQLVERSQWWSLQPLKNESLPEVHAADWSKEPVDRFVRSALDEAGLLPAKGAQPEILLRRLAFVLTGLPPKPGQIRPFAEAFAGDAEAALDQLVDDLLASPHFGERFARHWMDVVRYTDTFGYEWDNPAKGSWEYRDYLIRAFNQDIGFDQLIREQIAGDLLAAPRINQEAGVNESLIGPMFYHMGEHRHGDSLVFNGVHQEMVNNKIDAFSKAFLAMTVACARCHDHKLDAISQTDYYALAGVFMSPRWTARSIDVLGKNDAAIEELIRLRGEIQKRMGQVWNSNRGTLSRGSSLRKWAHANRSTLVGAKIDDVAWPLAQLLSDTATDVDWLKAANLSAKPAAKSTELVVENDGAILAQGELAETDAYTVKFTTDPGDASLLRLEALTHPSLGEGGPGRTAHGNFVLTHVRVEVKPLAAPGSQPRPVQKLIPTSARADYSQPGYPVTAALDPATRSGWGVGLGGNVDRTAWFTFAKPVELPHGGEWTVTLEHHYGSRHVLGRFRLTPGLEKASPRASDGAIKAAWQQLATEWRTTRESRLKIDAGKFTVLSDFSEPGLPDGWSAEGDGIQHGYVVDGAPRVSLSGETIVDQLLPRGYHTHSLSSKLAGAVRLPAQDKIPGRQLSLKLRGGEWAGQMVVPQNAFQTEPLTFLDPAAPLGWKTFADRGLKPAHGITRMLPEIMTSSLHSNFPPRTGLARAGKVTLPPHDDGFNKRSWFSLTGIVAHDAGGVPQNTLELFTPLFEGESPALGQDAWQRVAAWFSDAVRRWSADEATSEDVKLLNWLLAQNLLPNQAKDVPDIAALVGAYREVESRIAYPRSVMSMDERGVAPMNYRINVRGDVYANGPAIPRDFLEVFAGQHRVAGSQGSGRLELAKYLSSRNNPQTARVYVNRVWQAVFGRGIVATPNDFGKLGARPSHPELLDWLSATFIEEGWSTKKLVRRLVLSRTFRQAGTVFQAAADLDPDNSLLHHYPTRRLEAEAIRDGLLAVSGRLDPQLFGQPINPPRLVEDGAKRLFSGPADSDGRRSIYMKMSIMDPPKFLVCFNLPDLKLPTGHRDVTNNPTQALALLNNPLVVQLSDHWGELLVKDGCDDPQQRVRDMFLRALGRSPGSGELQRWTEAVASYSKSDDVMTDAEAWSELAHLFFNTKEFIYYR